MARTDLPPRSHQRARPRLIHHPGPDGLNQIRARFIRKHPRAAEAPPAFVTPGVLCPLTRHALGSSPDIFREADDLRYCRWSTCTRILHEAVTAAVYLYRRLRMGDHQKRPLRATVCSTAQAPNLRLRLQLSLRSLHPLRTL